MESIHGTRDVHDIHPVREVAIRALVRIEGPRSAWDQVPIIHTRASGLGRLQVRTMIRYRRADGSLVPGGFFPGRYSEIAPKYYKPISA